MDWTQVLITVITLVFTGVIIPVGKAFWVWLKSKTKNEALLTALTEAEKVADNVVAGLQQNVVEGMKAKSADGKLSPNDMKEIAKLAFETFVSDLSTRSYAVLEENADSIREYIGNLIEARLLKLKASTTSS